MHELTALPNGARLVTQAVPGARTAALGFFVGAGSRHEGPGEAGAAHFIEHMLFKGTARRTTLDLARETDAIGGQLNAYTTKESTCYYLRCLDSHLARGADLLCDMFFQSRFDQGDVELERGVILEEIDMYEDTPEEVCADRLSAAAYRGNALGRPILGRASTLSAMTGDSLRQWQQRHYTPGRVVVSLSGNFSPAVAGELAARLAELPARKAPKERTAAYGPGITVRKKAIEQNHLILAFPALSYLDGRRPAITLLNTILGGGVSSRLFQELREQRGLCYSVYSYLSDHVDTGLWGIYAALGRDAEEETLSVVCRLAAELAEKGATLPELERAREQAKANVVMGLESVQARMNHLGSSILFFDRVRTQEEILAEYDAVTLDDLRSLAEEFLDFSRLSFSAVGRVQSAEAYRERLGAF